MNLPKWMWITIGMAVTLCAMSWAAYLWVESVL